MTRIINSPPRGIGAKTVETVAELAQEKACPMFDILSDADRYGELQRSAVRLRLFANTIRELKSFSETHSPELVFDELLEKTGYLRMLESSEEDKDQSRAENVKELKSSILSFMKESGDLTLDGYLANVALYTDLDNYDREADSVVLMTMHSAKGLEFPTVFIVGMEETIFPGMRASGEPEEMEEERRLCYVALTRAKRRLYLVCARQRMLFGRTTANRASRFVDEIPEEHIRKNLPKGYGYRERREEAGYASYNRWDEPGSGFALRGRREEQSASARPYRTESGAASRPAAPRPRPAYTPAPPKPAAPPQSFAVGDKVRHKAFGAGEIAKMTPMGGDHLVEIRVEKVGVKKLMLRAAAQHMTKE